MRTDSLTSRFSFLLLFLAPLLAMGGPDSLQTLQLIRVDTTAVAPVLLGHDTLFTLRVGTRGMSVAKRAETASRRITEQLAESTLPLDSLKIDDAGVTSDIVVQDRLILPIFDIDASLRGTTRADLAERHIVSIRTAVERYREERSKSTLLWGVALSAVATVILILVWRALWRVGKWIEKVLGARVRGISLQHVEIVRVEWLRAVLRVASKFFRTLLYVLLVYSYLEFALSRFVWTRPLADHLLDLTLGPLKTMALSFWDYLPNLFFLIVLFFVTRYVVKFFRFIFAEIETGKIVLPGFYPEWGTPTFKLVRILVVAFVLVVAFPYIPGSDSPAFKGISIFLGVLFSLGSTSAVANIVAGVILTYMRSFRVGDFVKIQDTVGTVISHGLLVTRIRTIKNVEVTIPNATVLGTHVINYSNEAEAGKLILPTSVTIGYDAPWRQVHALLQMAAAKTAGVLKDPKPFVLQPALNDFYVTYELNVYTDSPEQMPRIYSDLHQNIQDAFNEYGVQIMSPNYVMDRAKPTVVPKEQWYTAPANTSEGAGADPSLDIGANGRDEQPPIPDAHATNTEKKNVPETETT
jgi:small-conductance mechanosensitive channel